MCRCLLQQGHYVTTFGLMGHDKGEFINPRGICMDEHNFIFVCDSYIFI